MNNKIFQELGNSTQPSGMVGLNLELVILNFGIRWICKLPIANFILAQNSGILTNFQSLSADRVPKTSLHRPQPIFCHTFHNHLGIL
jgi:hypothetical protein